MIFRTFERRQVKSTFGFPAVLLGLLALLAGCPEKVAAPVAVIELSTPEPIVAGTEVVLDGSGSHDAEGNANSDLLLSYHWRFVSAPAGSQAALNRVDVPRVSFVADQYGQYVIGLIVDNGILSSAEATLAVTVQECGNAVPQVDSVIPSPAAPGVDELVTLAISVSDADNIEGCGLNQTLDVVSSFVGRPAGSQAALSPAEGLSPAFIPDVPGAYIIRTTVSDGTGRSSFADTVVTASACGDAAPQVDSVAASPAAPGVGELTTLTISVSDADNGEGCAFDQTIDVSSSFAGRPAGSQAVLYPAEGLSPAFVPDVPGDYIVRTTVSDGTGRSSFADTVVTASACGDAAPQVDSVAASPAAPAVGELTTLAVSVSDSDNGPECGLSQTLNVASAFVGRPAGSQTVLSPAEGLSPAFIPDVPGTYIIRTTVSDGTGRRSFADTTVTVSVCGSQEPLALIEVIGPVVAGPGINVIAPDVNTDDTVALDGSASFDPDEQAPCGLTVRLLHHWRFVSKPANSNAGFNDANITNPSFRTDRPGSYGIELTVSDGQHVSYAYLTITANPAVVLGTAPGFTVTFVAGQDAYFDRPEGVTVDGGGAIYVAQNGNDSVTRSAGGVTTRLSQGGWLQNIHDVAWYSADDTFFVTSKDVNAVIRLDQAGNQTLWSQPGQADRPANLVLFVDSFGNERLLVMEEGNDQIDFFDPTDTPLATRTGTENFGGNLGGAWGVDAAVIGGVNIYYGTDRGNDELWRTDTGTDRRLADFLDNPRDVARTLSGSGRLAVADSGSGMLLLIDDCGGPPCPAQTVAWGPWEPWGLHFENANDLLVTDRNGDSLFRVSGPF